MQPDQQTDIPAQPTTPSAAPPVTPTVQAATTQPAPMSSWPGAFGIFKPSREAVRLNLKTLLLLLVISIVANLVISIALIHVTIVADVLSAIVGAFLSVAQIHTFLKSSRGNKVELNESINEAKPQWLQMVFLNILVGLSVLGGFLLLIIPGLIIWPRLALASYFLVDQKLGAVDAYKASWAATKGHVGKIWGITGVSSLMVLPAITIIGIIATAYLIFMYQAAQALLYIYILAHLSPVAVQAEVTSPVTPAAA